jgi:hypothetical protein
MGQWVVVAPGRKFSVVCFLEVTSLSIFWSEPGRNAISEAGILGRNGLGGAARSGEIGGCFALARRKDFDNFLRERTGLEFGNFLKSLMCVLASVRNFSVVCFEQVTPNSVCWSVPVRSGLDHLHFVSRGYANLRSRDMIWVGNSRAAAGTGKAKASGLKT